jgi:hypothetical protein
MAPGGREGPQYGKPYLHVFILTKIFSRTSRPVSMEFGANYPRVMGILNWSNKGSGLLQRGNNYKNAKMERGHLKFFFSRTTEPE